MQCCGKQQDNDAVQRALKWLGERFSVTRHPGPRELENRYLYYYLYALERVGRLTGQRFIGRHDWYREGAEFLVGQQDSIRGMWYTKHHAERNPLVATPFALLFLSKGRRPVVVDAHLACRQPQLRSQRAAGLCHLPLAGGHRQPPGGEVQVGHDRLL